MSASFERRKYFRHEILEMRRIEYALNGFLDSKTFEGIVLNISNNGISLLISNRFDIGQEIILKDFDIYGSSKTATVQWIKKADRRHYKAGLIFFK